MIQIRFKGYDLRLWRATPNKIELYLDIFLLGVKPFRGIVGTETAPLAMRFPSRGHESGWEAP